MKTSISVIIKKLATIYSTYKNAVAVSLAIWVAHIVLRVLLLFRSNPYGFPFVSKPDWYIFHAISLDFIWISKSLVIFIALVALINLAKQKIVKSSKQSSIAPLYFYSIFHAIILEVTLLDHEIQRFLGSHLSFGLANTYKDASSILMFWDYCANDVSVPFLQFFVLVLILPFTYFIYRLFKAKNVFGKKTIISMAVFYIIASLFINVIWTGNARMAKLRPVVSLAYKELFEEKSEKKISEAEINPYIKAYRNLWQTIEEDSLWEFSTSDNKNPLYRIPTRALTEDSLLKSRRSEKPNFIVIFMESERGLNVGFLNPNEKPSPTPFLDSIAEYSHVFKRMHASGLPTTGGVLSTHTGIPHHSKLAEATDLAHVTIPSFASVLTDSGYTTHYFSAADPAWDNLGVWMSKWYTAQHYDRNREDDSVFFRHAVSYVVDTLAKKQEPFLATFATRSNHYPFNFAAGMSEEDKQKPLTERIKSTMNYADRQVAYFIHSLEKEEWYKNTYVIILADHGFPLGENGVSTMNGGAFSNATWIPFLIYGKDIEAKQDSITTAQIDIAPTILELAGLAVPNMFMGHNLLRGSTKGISLGAYSGISAIGKEGFRLIAKPPFDKESAAWLFAENDMHQKSDLAEQQKETVLRLKNVLDSLITISDYSLEKGW